MKRFLYGVIFLSALLLSGCDLFSPSVAFNLGEGIEFLESGFVASETVYSIDTSIDLAFDATGNFKSYFYSFEEAGEDYNGNAVTGEGLVTNGSSFGGTYSYDSETMTLTMVNTLDYNSSNHSWTNFTTPETREFSAAFYEHILYTAYPVNTGQIYVKQSDGSFKYFYRQTLTNFVYQEEEVYGIDKRSEEIEYFHKTTYTTNSFQYRGEMEYTGGIYETQPEGQFERGFSGTLYITWSSHGFSDYDTDEQHWLDFDLETISTTRAKEWFHERDFILDIGNNFPMRQTEEEVK